MVLKTHFSAVIERQVVLPYMRWNNQLYVIILFCSRIRDTYSNGLGRTRSKPLPKVSTIFTFTVYHLEKSACCLYILLYDFREKKICCFTFHFNS